MKLFAYLKKKEHTNIISNFLALGMMQFLNFVIPLLVLPYVIRVIGFSNFGVVSWIQTMIIYFVMITDYGFNFTATRELALIKNDFDKVCRIFSEVIYTKILLNVLILLLMLVMLVLIRPISQESVTFMLAFTMVLGQSFTLNWFFQGIEKMFWITLITFLSKIIFLLLVFSLIQEKDHYIYYLFSMGISHVFGAVLSILIAVKSFKLKLVKVSLKEVILQLKEGFHIFLANLATGSIMYTNLLILGFFEKDKNIVGFYAAAEKVIFAIWQLLSVFSQAIYPHICQLAARSHQELRVFFAKFYLPFALAILGLCTLIFFSADYIIWLLSGEKNASSVLFLRMLAFVPFIVALNIPFYQTLLAYNLLKDVSRVMLLTFAVNLCFCFLLIPGFSSLGTTLAVIFTEIFLTVSLMAVIETQNKLCLMRSVF